MVGEEDDLFSFGKLRKGCFSLNDLRHNMDISRLPNSTEKDYVRLERYQEEYEMLMEMLREVCEIECPTIDKGKVQVVIKDETIWCTQKAMAELFDINKSGISRHITNIFKEEELQQDTTVAKIATVVNRGIRGEVEELVDFYNLDMIIAVDYRVSSPKATKFRQWATKILNEYIKKGVVLDALTTFQ